VEEGSDPQHAGTGEHPTYRTPEAMLPSAQDYRKGYGGDQQHIWQATLGPEAVVFTTHPASRESDEGGSSPNSSPNYWTGSGTLPRVGQYRNVALWSRNPCRWAEEYGGRSELVAMGKENIWICEVVRAATSGGFERFVERTSSARTEHRGLSVRYHSPTAGLLSFGWRGKLRVNGRPAPLRGYPRYGNPYTDSSFPAETVTLQAGGAWLELDWRRRARTASGYL
jgi:hypothetical protein